MNHERAITANAGEIVSIAPATGEAVFRARVGNVDGSVAKAQRAWPNWAAQPLVNRIEFVRRFANELRKDAEALARMAAEETGKPLWEATAEVEATIGRVEM